MALEYDIIKSGSSGNCVVIGDVMVDCGISYSEIKEFLYDIKYLLITHIHCDHLNKKTLQRIKREFPRIIIIGNYDVAQNCDVDLISNEGYAIITKDYEFLPFAGDHDTLVHGYVWESNGGRIIYITDTAHLDNAPWGRYDWFFIESNHDENKIKTLKNQRKKYGYDVYKSSLRHLSTQKAKAFYYNNRKDKSSKFIELHKSERFY